MQFLIFSPAFYILHISLFIAILLLIFNKQAFNFRHYLAYSGLIFAFLGYSLQTIHYLYNAHFFNPLPLCLIAGSITSILVLILHIKVQQLTLYTPQSPAHFVGYFATIHSEKARTDQPAIAYIRDEYGIEHYISVIAESGEITQYTPVIVIRLAKQYYVVRNIQSLVE